MPTFFLNVSVCIHTAGSDFEEPERYGFWAWMQKGDIEAGTVPGIDPRPGSEPDPDPEPAPDPDPGPLPTPLPDPGPDPGFPIDPFPRPVPIRVTAVFRCGFD